ncbi:hypothetical protein [Pedobacter aquatilis]|uniref:hypothetical protein n=1 Tax=Pedobacter aquatilis TaxID=351343 RepID=UPI002930B3C8|nr:hypothetical protein [Pedobacter aquatilis]
MITIFLLFTYLSVCSQVQFADSPIVKAMQRIADTTILIQHYSVWKRSPNVQFLSKKGDTINTYDYKQPKYTLKINSTLPKTMAKEMYSNHYDEFWKESVSINRFFKVVDKSPDSLWLFWNQVMKLKPWNINDDAVDGEGCPLVKGKGVMSIDDAGGIYILLVTKTSIKPLNFYALHDYEKFCPGRKGRQAAIKLLNIFFNAFKE